MRTGRSVPYTRAANAEGHVRDRTAAPCYRSLPGAHRHGRQCGDRARDALGALSSPPPVQRSSFCGRFVLQHDQRPFILDQRAFPRNGARHGHRLRYRRAIACAVRWAARLDSCAKRIGAWRLLPGHYAHATPATSVRCAALPVVHRRLLSHTKRLAAYRWHGLPHTHLAARHPHVYQSIH